MYLEAVHPQKQSKSIQELGCGFAQVLLYSHVSLCFLMPFLELDQWGSLHSVVVAVYVSLLIWVGELIHHGFKSWVWLLPLIIIEELSSLLPHRKTILTTTAQLCSEPGIFWFLPQVIFYSLSTGMLRLFETWSYLLFNIKR